MVFIQVTSDVFDFGCGCLLRPVLSFRFVFFFDFLEIFLNYSRNSCGIRFEWFDHALNAFGVFRACKRAKTLFFSVFVFVLQMVVFWVERQVPGY